MSEPAPQRRAGDTEHASPPKVERTSFDALPKGERVAAKSAPAQAPAAAVALSQTTAEIEPPGSRPAAGAAVPLSQRRKGELTKEAIRRAIQRQMRSVKGCWERALTRDPNTGMRLTVRFEIDPHGRVASAERVGLSTGDASLDECVLEAVEAFVFPAPAGDGHVIVTYPIIVDSTGG